MSHRDSRCLQLSEAYEHCKVNPVPRRSRRTIVSLVDVDCGLQRIIWYKQLLHLHFGKVSCFRSSPSRLRDLIQEPSFSVDNRWTPLPSIREVLYLEASGTLHYARHMRVGIDDHRRAFTSEDFSLGTTAGVARQPPPSSSTREPLWIVWWRRRRL